MRRRVALSPTIERMEMTTRDGIALLDIEPDSRPSPLHVVEEVADLHDWAFERSGEDEISVLVKGEHSDYQVSFTWMAEIESLHIACTFDMRVPEARKAETQRLVAMINEQ